MNNTLHLSIHKLRYQRIIMNNNMDGYSKKGEPTYIEWKLKKTSCIDPAFDNAAIKAILNISNIVMQSISDSILG